MHHAQMVAAMRAYVNQYARQITQPGTAALSFDARTHSQRRSYRGSDRADKFTFEK